MISIIIPIYNVEKYLAECLDSIIAQNLNNYEIICINDGSTDASIKILKKYQKTNKHIRIHSQKNSGPGVARNLAINLARGNYICFIDPDDKLESINLSLAYDYAINKNAEVVQFNYKTFYNEQAYKEHNFAKQILELYDYDLNKTPYYNYKDVFENCLHAFDMHVVNKLYLKDFIIRNNIIFTDDRYAEDWLFAIKTLIKANKIYYFDKYVYNYRLRAESLCNSKHRNVLDIFNVFKKVENFLKDEKVYELLLEQYQQYKFQIILWSYDCVPISLYFKFYIQSFRFLDKKFYLKFFKYILKKSIKKIFNIKKLTTKKTQNNNYFMDKN